jgi:hypothetical protein
VKQFKFITLAVLLVILASILVVSGPRQSVHAQPMSKQDFYATIWEKQPSAPDWIARHQMTATEYEQALDSLTGQGYRLVEISGYEVNDQARLAAIWEKSSGMFGRRATA